MGFTNVWNDTFPPDTEAANLIGANLRQLRVDVQERMSAISGLDAAKPAFGADDTPANWTGILFFATDTGKIYQWNGVGWIDITANFVTGVVARTTVGPLNTAQALVGLYFTNPGGIYRATVDSIVNTADSSGFVNPTIYWNNGLAAQSQLGAALNLNTLGNEVIPATSFQFYAAPSTTISWSTSYTGTGVGFYTVNIRLEYLG